MTEQAEAQTWKNAPMPAFDDFKTQSDSISKIALALSKAQSKMTSAKKSAKNPFFNSTYADLSSVWDALRTPLAEQELAVIQTPVEDTRGTAIVTTLAHSSGEWFRSKLYITPKAKDAQSVGSAITYARRYALAAITGIAPDDDDDGEKAVRPEGAKPKAAAAPEPKAQPAPGLATQSEEPVTWDIGQTVMAIEQMLGKMNGGELEGMNEHLKLLTKYVPKGGTEEKFLKLDDLPRIGKNSADWLKRVHKKVTEEYQRAFDANGNPK